MWLGVIIGWLKKITVKWESQKTYNAFHFISSGFFLLHFLLCFYLFKNICIGFCLPVCLCIVCMQCMYIYRDQKKTLDSLELELITVVSHHVSSENWTWSSARAASALTHWATAPVASALQVLSILKVVIKAALSRTFCVNCILVYVLSMHLLIYSQYYKQDLTSWKVHEGCYSFQVRLTLRKKKGNKKRHIRNESQYPSTDCSYNLEQSCRTDLHIFNTNSNHLF